MKQPKNENNDFENDDIDRLCYSYFHSNRDIPINIKNNIKITCDNLKNNRNKTHIQIQKILALGLCFVIIAGSIVYGNNIKEFVIKTFFNNSEGIQTAMHNNYISVPTMEYVESNGIELKISKIIMDDYNLGINFSIRLDEFVKDYILETNEIKFKNILISDESNNILYCNNESIFRDYCLNQNLNYSFGDFNSKYINSGLNSYTSVDENNSEINCIYNLYSNSYPKSKKLYITINDININDNEIKCNWNLELDISEEFYNREVYIYKAKENNYENINFKEISVYNTMTRIEMEVKLKEGYQDSYYKTLAKELIAEGISSQEITDIINEERKKNNYDGNILSPNLFDDIYIVNSQNKKFYKDLNLIDGNYAEINKDTLTAKITFTFSLTQYDSTDNLCLHFIYNNQEYNIDLVRK